MTTTNKERRLAVTPGEAIIRHDYNVFAGDRLVCNAGGHQNNHDNGKGDAENRANARLYADAHNTYNACDMLPSDLLTQVTKLRAERDELVGAAMALHVELRHNLNGGGWNGPLIDRLDGELLAILAKHKPE